MIDISAIRTAVVDLLTNNTGCEAVLANQTAHIPQHPYISFTITTPLTANNGGWGRYDDGVDRKPVKQIWSITAQSKTHDEAFTLAMKAHNVFDTSIGRKPLYEDHGISIEQVGDITNRDTLLTNFYEYRCGFDVTFTMFDEIDISTLGEGEITSADIKYNERKE